MGTDTMYVHHMGHYSACTYFMCDKGGSTENQSYGNSTCTQRNTVSFTQCVHLHNSVTEIHCEGIFTY